MESVTPSEVRETFAKIEDRLPRLLQVHRKELNQKAIDLIDHAAQAVRREHLVVTSVADETAMSADAFVRAAQRSLNGG